MHEAAIAKWFTKWFVQLHGQDLDLKIHNISRHCDSQRRLGMVHMHRKVGK
jgi:hypothetical protein